MVAARKFVELIKTSGIIDSLPDSVFIRCTLKGSLAFTGKGHCSDRAIALGVHGYTPERLASENVNELFKKICEQNYMSLESGRHIQFNPDTHIIFDKGETLPEHPNGMIFELVANDKGNERVLTSQTYFSIGGGFISTPEEIEDLRAPLKMKPVSSCRYPFDSANSMLKMAGENKLSISEMKRLNELDHRTEESLNKGLDSIWLAMQTCLERGLDAKGCLPGGLNLARRAKHLFDEIQKNPEGSTLNDWLCAYAMAVNEENAAGHMVVTAPTNGAAGVIPAVLYYFVKHENGTIEQVRNFLLTASAIGGIIKFRSSISGAEVGCQGEVGSAAAMAAAGLCEVKGGTPHQVENAAEIALEHHLGMTCDPVKGLVQVPCIERNGFGAVKAYTAASLALKGSGVHFMPLDNCIAAMKQTGLEMSQKFKETSLGGLAVSYTEC